MKSEAEQKAEHALLVSQGVDNDEAWFRINGYSPAQAKLRADALKRQIDRQRKKAGKAPLYAKK